MLLLLVFVPATRADAQEVAPLPLRPAAERPQKVEVDEVKVAELVRSAYLRALSRPPTIAEADRSRQYIADATDTIDGVRDLMWALLNTKEFIVNH